MASRNQWQQNEIKTNPLFSKLRSTVETAFYGNNVDIIKSVTEAYNYAKSEPGVITLDMPIYKAVEQGLPTDAKVLLTNDGKTTGRYAKARRIIGDQGIDEIELCDIAREAVYDSRHKHFLHAQVLVGLHEDFSIKAHLMIPEEHASILYSWLLNFKFFSEDLKEFYANSKQYPEGDIYIYSDPDYVVPGQPGGLAIFDPEHNCAMIIGMRYFGEHKKGTLTLAWSYANRYGYIACHGGMKRYNLNNNKTFTLGVFGLSGSGKSTLTHEKHDGHFDINVLHDDAYIINTQSGASIALEPTYFDKMQDYPIEHPANKYLLTIQNCGVTLDEQGHKVVLAEDVRNNNGRAIKSVYWTENRVNYFADSVNAIAWLMKDETLPPIIKVTDPRLAAIMGATLATRRSTAEKLDVNVDAQALVIEPYANPFRTYPLAYDYKNFKKLFASGNVDCYIINTGFYGTKKITKEVTLNILEKMVTDTLEFKPFGRFPHLTYASIEGFEPNFTTEYEAALVRAFKFRKEFVQNQIGKKNELPVEVLEVLNTIQ